MKKTLFLALLLLSTYRLTSAQQGVVVGLTEYDHQGYVDSGNTIAVDDSGGIHLIWTKGVNYPTTRYLCYNYRTPSGTWVFADSGKSLSLRNMDGYAQLALVNGANTVVAYHNGAAPESLFVTREIERGSSIFQRFHVPNILGSDIFLWPLITVDLQGIMHVTVTRRNAQFGPRTIAYTNSEDGGLTWTPLHVVDSIEGPSRLVPVSSPVSNKVALVWVKLVPNNITALFDVFYLQSENGRNWDWEYGGVNITNYGADHDSLFGYRGMIDAAYDYNDDLHIVWQTCYTSSSDILPDIALRHYCTGTGITSFVHEDTNNWIHDCAIGYGNGDGVKMRELSLGVYEPNNAMFLAYTLFDIMDCSDRSLTNGEVYMQYSTDRGLSWSLARNITNSPSPWCNQTMCESDIWPSLAERVDSCAHIIYINDRYAGEVTYPPNQYYPTENPVLYLGIPNPVYTVPNTGIVMGIIRDITTNQPIQGISVSARNIYDIVSVDTTDADGFYSCKNLLPRTYNVITSHEWYLPVQIDSVDVIADETTFVNIMLQPELPGAIKGTILRRNSTQVIEGAIIRASIDSGEVARDTTDSAGFYSMSWLHEALYNLEISAVDHRTEFIDSIEVLALPHCQDRN